MAITKRLRYEILRRDGHACRYCGAKAPDVELTVDHVTPKALGGTDDPANLVAACRACNTGKASSSPDAAMVADVDQAAVDWARRVRAALAEMADADDATRAAISRFADAWAWHEAAIGTHPMDPDYEATLRTFLTAGVPLAMLLRFAERAVTSPHVRPADHWRYFCGICWATIREAQQRAGRQP